MSDVFVLGGGIGGMRGWELAADAAEEGTQPTGDEQVIVLTRGGHRLTGRLREPGQSSTGRDVRLVDEAGRHWLVAAGAIDAVSSSTPPEPPSPPAA